MSLTYLSSELQGFSDIVSSSDDGSGDLDVLADASQRICNAWNVCRWCWKCCQ